MGAAVLGRRERDVPRDERGQALARARPPARHSTSCCGSRTAPTSSSRACGRATAEERGFGPDALRGRNPRLVYATDRRLRPHGPVERAARLRPARAGRGRHPLGDGGSRTAGRARRRLARSTRARACGRRSACSPRCMERERTGEGSTVDVSLYETAIAYMAYHLTGYLGSGVVPGRTGTGFPSIAPYQVFATADGDADGRGRRTTACSRRSARRWACRSSPSDARFATNPTARRAPR